MKKSVLHRNAIEALKTKQGISIFLIFLSIIIIFMVSVITGMISVRSFKTSPKAEEENTDTSTSTNPEAQTVSKRIKGEINFIPEYINKTSFKITKARYKINNGEYKVIESIKPADQTTPGWTTYLYNERIKIIPSNALSVYTVWIQGEATKDNNTVLCGTYQQKVYKTLDEQPDIIEIDPLNFYANLRSCNPPNNPPGETTPPIKILKGVISYKTFGDFYRFHLNNDAVQFKIESENNQENFKIIPLDKIMINATYPSDNHVIRQSSFDFGTDKFITFEYPVEVNPTGLINGKVTYDIWVKGDSNYFDFVINNRSTQKCSLYRTVEKMGLEDESTIDFGQFNFDHNSSGCNPPMNPPGAVVEKTLKGTIDFNSDDPLLTNNQFKIESLYYVIQSEKNGIMTKDIALPADQKILSRQMKWSIPFSVDNVKMILEENTTFQIVLKGTGITDYSDKYGRNIVSLPCVTYQKIEAKNIIQDNTIDFGHLIINWYGSNPSGPARCTTNPPKT